ncbi:hypothetical protein MBLNU457_4403t1 [Dothideomycetes sp. NU457]
MEEHMALLRRECRCDSCLVVMCTGCSFFNGYEPVPEPEGELNIQQMKEDALRLSKDIFRSFRHLGLILDHHQDMLQKRWLKKTVAKKEAVLAEAWPGIP